MHLAAPRTVSITSSAARDTDALTASLRPEADVLDGLRLARDHDHPSWPTADVLDEPQHGLRVHAVRVEHLPVLDLAVDIVGVCLHHVQRSRPLRPGG